MRLDRRIHALLLLLQAGLERLPQLHGDELVVQLLREDERRACGERPGAGGSLRPRLRVDAYDLRQLLAIERVVVRRLVDLGDLEAGLEGGLDRLRELLDVARVRVERAVVGRGLLVEVAGDEQRLAAQRRILGLGGEASYSPAARDSWPLCR